MDILSIIKWWVDASDITHMDCKGHSIYAMSIGKGDIIIFYKKQNLKTKSSTETELVGADDALLKVFWVCILSIPRVTILIKI